MRRRGGIFLEGIEPEDLLGEALETFEAYECSRAIVVEDLPEATIGFLAALAGFLMASEFVKDRVGVERRDPLDARRPALRLDVFGQRPGPECVEEYVPRRSCACQVQA